jgi:hypothetical protein
MARTALGQRRPSPDVRRCPVSVQIQTSHSLDRMPCGVSKKYLAPKPSGQTEKSGIGSGAEATSCAAHAWDARHFRNLVIKPCDRRGIPYGRLAVENDSDMCGAGRIVAPGFNDDASEASARPGSNDHAISQCEFHRANLATTRTRRDLPECHYDAPSARCGTRSAKGPLSRIDADQRRRAIQGPHGAGFATQGAIKGPRHRRRLCGNATICISPPFASSTSLSRIAFTSASGMSSSVRARAVRQPRGRPGPPPLPGTNCPLPFLPLLEPRAMRVIVRHPGRCSKNLFSL